MDHAVHAANIDEHAVAGHGLDHAVIVLADLDVGPDLSLRGRTGLVLHSLDGADDAAAGTVNLGDAELNALLDELAQIAVLGQTALGSGNEHTHALDGNDDAALVFFGDDALENGLVLNGILDVLPDLDRVEALLGKGGIALHVVDADDVGLNLVADMDDVLDLGIGIAGKLADGNVARLLAAQVDLNLGRTDGRDDTGHLISCI